MLKTLRDVEIKDKNILVRTDYNVPLVTDDEGNQSISSDLRIRASLPTLQYLLEQGAAKIILMSHLGRPKGQDEKLSLKPVALMLSELLPGVPLSFVDNVSGPEVEQAVDDLPHGGILVLENLRFWPGEKENSTEFAEEIVSATRADLFVQDGFAVLHRAHASTSAITKLLPSFAGFLVEKEVSSLQKVLENPAHPFLVVIGGAKVDDKQPLINKLSPLADQIFVGGKIAADGFTSEKPKVYVAEDFDQDEEGTKLDVGPVATTKLAEQVLAAKTVLWNGVLGKVEDPTYATSSTILAKMLGENPTTTSIICGGDTTGFVEDLAAENPELKFTLVSTGGGAALELLSGAEMPGLKALC